MRLSENLDLSEMIKSDIAIRHGIKNYPTDGHLGNMIMWAENIFQPIRDYFGEPIFISSGYRSRELNNLISGSLQSQHCVGQAGDIDQDHRMTMVSNADVFDFVLNYLDYDQLILEYPDEYDNPSWVHVSYISEEKNRNQPLVAVKEDKITKYYEYNV